MKRTATLFVLLFPLLLSAQPEAYNWYFGNGRGLDFSSGTPIPLTDGAIQAPEGCASFSDENGNLLFYTNGGGRDPILSGGQPSGIIWNRDHEIMYDMGNTEGGGFSARQSSLILPNPNSVSNYFLFTMEEIEFNLGGPVPGQPQGRGLSLFEIDMSQNGGLGEVVIADQRIYTPTYEALSATIHANEDAYWVVILEANENANQVISVFVDGDGIGQEDVQPQIVDFQFPLDGTLKIAPHSNWLATFNYIFSFDNESGLINNVPVVEMPRMTHGSFSPSSRYYYYWRETATATLLARMDMTSSDIEDSEEILLNLPSQIVAGQFQLAPNGNIYFIYTVSIGNNPEYFVGEITCPDSPSPTIEEALFSYDIDLEDPMQFPLYSGLPNFADHIFKAQDTDLATQTRRLCPDEELVLTPRIDGVSYEWNDGSTADSLTIITTGLYTVTITDACGVMIVDEKEVLARELPVVVIDSLPADLLCAGDSFELTVIPERFEEILWSTGDTTETITATETATYTVTMTNVCGSTSEDIVLEFLDTPTIDIAIDPAGGICPGESGELTALASGDLTYEWNTGDTTATIVTTIAGEYSVAVDNGCFENSNAVTLVELSLPTIETINPVTMDSLCLAADELTLEAVATNADELAWSFQEEDVIVILEEGSLTTTVQANGVYDITASNACGFVQDSIEVGLFIECLEEECGLELPEVFSPNNDGLNDRFGAFTNCAPLDYQLIVYSRWGKEVFSTADVTEYWQGDFEGEAAPSDAYLYQMQYRFSATAELTTLRGSLTLIR